MRRANFCVFRFSVSQLHFNQKKPPFVPLAPMSLTYHIFSKCVSFLKIAWLQRHTVLLYAYTHNRNKTSKWNLKIKLAQQNVTHTNSFGSSTHFLPLCSRRNRLACRERQGRLKAKFSCWIQCEAINFCLRTWKPRKRKAKSTLFLILF